MSEAAATLRAGDMVRIRDQRWRIVSHYGNGDTAIIEATGCDPTNSGSRACFLLPFEPVDRLPLSAAPRVVRPARWRGIVRHILANATPSWTSLRAASRAQLTLIPFQLEPTLALIRGDACRFLIADGVGLGKTVQAGFMIAELLERRPDSRVLIVSPAALREQWRHELWRRFSIEAEVLDAAAVARLAADLPGGINPWAVRRVIVTSIDYVKRAEVMRALEPLTWDLAAFDEAHNLAGRSDRAAAAHQVSQRSRAVVLLTATPHSGDEQAFRRLCSLGNVNNAYPLLMFRRSRSAAGLTGTRRTTLLRVRLTAAEAAMHGALMAYARRAWNESAGGSTAGARLAMTVLTRRACSSASSLARSVERRLALLQEAPPHDTQFYLPFADLLSDDGEPEACLGSPGLRDVDEERARLEELLELARAASSHESKFCCLRRLLHRIGEPAIIFTEYRDTLERLAAQFADISSVQLHGGLTSRERLEVLSRFTAGDCRLLFATDAASEGLNLHQRCRLVVNLELPWTPARLDQRLGRVDRIGQSRKVHAIRLVAADTCEESIVARLARRADRARDALDVMPDESAVAESVLGLKPIAAGGNPGPGSSPAVIHVDLNRHAVEEAERLRRAAAWLQGSCDDPQRRPVITRLRRRHASRRQCLWAYRVSVTSASGHAMWRTLVAADCRLARMPRRSASSTRSLLEDSTKLQQAITRAHARLVESTRDIARRPLALWRQRERDLMAVIRGHHARMSAALLQGSLFDRRNDRAAASQAAMRDEALARCHERLEELRDCEHLSADECDLAFAVMLE